MNASHWDYSMGVNGRIMSAGVLGGELVGHVPFLWWFASGSVIDDLKHKQGLLFHI